MGLSHSKSMENLLISTLQTGDIRVMIDYALEFNVQLGHDHVCRTQAEYEQKSAAVIRGVERMSPLLNVVVNEAESEGIPPRIGSFEISMELTRVVNKPPVTIVLHSMATTGCFPNSEDIKKKIEAIILYEAKRSPGEEIYLQACRHLLAIADQTRHNRARTFMESVINRKLVLTERKVAAMFAKIGFFFALSELPEVVGYLKRIQETYSRTQSHRMDDLPSLSMLSPTSSGLYTLPFLNSLSISATLGALPSSWRFICVLVDHDFQLIDFVHAECPVSEGRGVTYRQTQSTYGDVIDRVHLRLTTLSARVFCILLSLQKILEDENDHNGEVDYLNEGQAPNGGPNVRVQLENVDERHVLGMFEARPTSKCRWFSLAAVYRAKKSSQWCLQALGGCGKAASIYCSLDEMNVLLAELHILQTYEVRVRFLTTQSASKGEGVTLETRECEEFAHQLAKNVRFGRNGRIVMLPKARNGGCEAALRITLKLQTLESEVEVYTHETSGPQPLPSLQSVCRSLLRLLAQHGIKECLQQNPFAPQNKQTKRHIEIRVVSAQTNEPVEKAHVFIEKNVEFAHLSSNLAKTVLPTLTMGSRLMSIRRRLQKKRTVEVTQETVVAFVAECLKKGTKLVVIASTRNVKLVAVIRARALLRGVMRRRREEIKAQIFEQVRKSEHAREYSRSEPMRLQRRFAPALVFSDSEQNLLKTSTGEELAVLEEMLRATTTKPSLETARLQEVERIQQGYLEKDLVKSIPAEEAGDSGIQTTNVTQSEVVTALQTPASASAPLVKERRHLFITDRDGRVSCRLVPGSYSLYVFHLDYFEWTSLVAIYPTITASGLYGGPSTSSISVQELVVPLDVFRWTYNLQLVDYYQPHIPTKIVGIPLQITDDCSSVHQIVTTDSNGCATWEVSKGLYAVDVLRECPCVLYSALKHVIVDGGRYRASRTIAVPVLFGSVKVTVIVVSAVTTSSSTATVRFQTAEESENLTYNSSGTEDEVAVGSLRAFQLELGAYRLIVAAPTFSEVSLPVNITWETSKTQARDRNRFLVVLSPALDEERTFRVVLSYVDGVEIMDAILEVWNGDALVGHVWRQDANKCSPHVELEAINSLDGCEHQSLLLRCQEGSTIESGPVCGCFAELLIVNV
ncbi:hypothetical protein BBJ28_00000342 [Nothophytophthora sp. Chile5]|nr:hypothetical protein BBJ28_00000342 [Nothophytophthora sp. Chile5]